MRTRPKTVLFLGALTFSAPSAGSSEVRELWASISFATESGDRVSIHTDDGRIAGVALSLKGARIDFPTNCFAGLGTPVLWGTRLSRSVFVEDNVRWEAQRLDIPLLEEGPGWDRTELFPVAVFHIVEGRVRSGNLWTDSRMMQKVKALCEHPE